MNELFILISVPLAISILMLIFCIWLSHFLSYRKVCRNIEYHPIKYRLKDKGEY